MSSPIEELRRALQELLPARRVAENVLRLHQTAERVVAFADQVGIATVEARRKAVEAEIAGLEARQKNLPGEVDQERRRVFDALAAEVTEARQEAKRVQERVGEETRGYILQQEAERAHVVRLLTEARITLKAIQTEAAAAEAQRRAAKTHAEAEETERRAAAEKELRQLEDRLMILRKEYKEIQGRLQALIR